MTSKWFSKGVQKRQPNTLGWSKDMPQERRLNRAYASCPKSWTHAHKLRRIIQALTGLANVTQDRETRDKARSDAAVTSRLLAEWNRKHGK